MTLLLERRVDWAHPQFGQVLATCSADTYVKIYKETDGKEDGSGGMDDAMDDYGQGNDGK